MARPLRRAVRDGRYHVFGRGLERRAIFGAESERRETARDREHFLELLNSVRIAGLGLDKNGRMLEGKGWRTPSREKADARLRRLREYRWSSYRAYAGYTPAPEWLETGELLNRAHRQAEQRQRAYRAAVRRRRRPGTPLSKVHPDPHGFLNSFRLLKTSPRHRLARTLALHPSATGLLLRWRANVVVSRKRLGRSLLCHSERSPGARQRLRTESRNLMHGRGVEARGPSTALGMTGSSLRLLQNLIPPPAREDARPP